MSARERRRLFLCLLLATLIGGAVALAFWLHLLPVLDRLQALTTDATVFRGRPASPAQRVALVQIDDATVEALRAPYGRVFSWPRSLHARVLRNLAAAGARVVVFDLLFDSPGCPPSGGASCPEDEAFGGAIQDATSGTLRPGAPPTGVVLAEASSPPEPVVPPGPGPFVFANALGPTPALAGRGALLGHIQATPDEDGTLRRLPLVITVGGAPAPALSLQAAAAYLRRPRPFDDLGPQAVLFAGRSVPTDAHAQALVNYLGPPSHRPALIGDATVPAVSFLDVLDGTFDAASLRDRVVFVGVTAQGFADDFWVPTSRSGVKMTGVEIHAQATEMLLRGAFLVPQGRTSTTAIIFALSLAVGALLSRWQPVLAGATAVLLFLVYVAVALFYGWSSQQAVTQSTTFTVLNSVFPGVGALGTTLAVMLYRIVFEQAEQRATRGAMGKYLSPTVMAEVLKDPTGLRLGGEKREMTVLFSDIRGFTTVAEQVAPERLVTFLNEYLTAMTEVVFAYEGVLDKYLGDGIMAFWGAPGLQPDHAQRACRAAYEMVHRLHELQPGWSAEGFPALPVGVGINTGVMTVGNVGSRQRFDYTVVGDAVNLASRLEEANKEYRSQIVIGEATRQRVDDLYVTRTLDRVAVRGRGAATTMYELLAPRDDAPRLLPEGFLELWEGALADFRAGRLPAARGAFARCLALRPEDGPAGVFLARCDALLAAAPQPPRLEGQVSGPKSG